MARSTWSPNSSTSTFSTSSWPSNTYSAGTTKGLITVTTWWYLCWYLHTNDLKSGPVPVRVLPGVWLGNSVWRAGLCRRLQCLPDRVSHSAWTPALSNPTAAGDRNIKLLKQFLKNSHPPTFSSCKKKKNKTTLSVFCHCHLFSGNGLCQVSCSLVASLL